MEYSGLINNYIKGNNQKMIKNNSMHNFMNNSFKYNNNTNIIQKTKSLKRFNSNTYKMKKILIIHYTIPILNQLKLKLI